MVATILPVRLTLPYVFIELSKKYPFNGISSLFWKSDSLPHSSLELDKVIPNRIKVLRRPNVVRTIKGKSNSHKDTEKEVKIFLGDNLSLRQS